jgi:hypothetical protein
MDEKTPASEEKLVLRPRTVDTRLKELTYPEDPNPCTVDLRDKLLTYPEDPNPWTVDMSDKELR